MTIVDVYDQEAKRNAKFGMVIHFSSILYLILLSEKIDVIYSTSMIIGTSFILIGLLYENQTTRAKGEMKKPHYGVNAHQLVAIPANQYGVNFYTIDGKKQYVSKAYLSKNGEYRFLVYHNDAVILHGYLSNGSVILSGMQLDDRLSVEINSIQAAFSIQNKRLGVLTKGIVPLTAQRLYDPCSFVLTNGPSLDEYEMAYILLLSHIFINKYHKLLIEV
ncbi:hypothetical protein WAK64_16605 [Bacillus spongiae]|uniref:Uncharacterized protein n=1 Tax=Bacillus spongiae TaxID=2683610 RepID=A0ABU8HH31_9BACI